MLAPPDRKTRVLIATDAFHPTIGGLQTAGVVLASGLSERGYDVTVVTPTPAEKDDFPFTVVRTRSARRMLEVFRAADLVWQNQISLRLVWPLAVVPRPTVFMHHAILRDSEIVGARFTALKRFLCRFGHNAFVSTALQRSLGLPGPVIPNTYDSETFRLIPGIERDREIAYLGRLETYKGVDTLIDAVGLLAARGKQAPVTVVGLGPEERNLRARVAERGVGDLVRFAGPLQGDALAKELNRHRILAVPSRGFEGFGLVAVEGMACGCVPVGTGVGGLPEAIGACGPIVAPDSPEELAAAIDGLLGQPDRIARYRQAAPDQLAKFSTKAVIGACDSLIREVLAGSNTAAVSAVHANER